MPAMSLGLLAIKLAQRLADNHRTPSKQNEVHLPRYSKGRWGRPNGVGIRHLECSTLQVVLVHRL